MPSGSCRRSSGDFATTENAIQTSSSPDPPLGSAACRTKQLLQAFYAQAIPTELLKSEQDRIGREIAQAEHRLDACEVQFDAIEERLELALDLVADRQQAYREAGPVVRRLFNQAFFERLLVDDNFGVRSEMAAPFSALLGPRVKRSARRFAQSAHPPIAHRRQGAGAHRPGAATTAAEGLLLWPWF